MRSRVLTKWRGYLTLRTRLWLLRSAPSVISFLILRGHPSRIALQYLKTNLFIDSHLLHKTNFPAPIKMIESTTYLQLCTFSRGRRGPSHEPVVIFRSTPRFTVPSKVQSNHTQPLAHAHAHIHPHTHALTHTHIIPTCAWTPRKLRRHQTSPNS